MDWPEIRRLHADVAETFAVSAESVPAERWLEPREEAKWSPAEIVEHLTLSYDTLLHELEGGPGMKIRTKWWQRLLLRFTLMPRLLRGGAFPKGARAPRETRPSLANPDQRAAVAAFRQRASQIDALTAGIVAGGRRVRLTHAYFGTAPIPKAMLLCARHIQHHREQMQAAGASIHA